jgi:cyclic pyranopterin monophosphate synthase
MARTKKAARKSAKKSAKKSVKKRAKKAIKKRVAKRTQKTTEALTHLDKKGAARMVDVSAKSATEREAIAEARIVMSQATLDLVMKGDSKKGDVFGAARIGGIMAAKHTHSLIPLCHPLPITKVSIDIAPDWHLPGLIVTATVKVTGPTGVEMEALTAASVACLTIYDMVKAVERGMHIEGVRLLEKSGGKSGHYRAEA